MDRVLFFFLLFFIALLPRFFYFDFVFSFSFSVFMLHLIKGRIVFDKNFFLVSCCVFILYPVSFVSFLFYGDYFGLLRLTKLVFLLFFLSFSLTCIEECFFYKWFPRFLLVNIAVLYVEYFNFLNLRDYLQELNSFVYGGRSVDYRAKGIYSGYSAAGVSSGFISIFAFYYTVKGKIEKKIGWILCFFAMLATFFTGRTGIVISMLGGFLFFIIFFKKILNVKFVFCFLLLVFLTYLFYYFELLFFFVDADVFKITVIRTFESFYNLSSGKGLSSESTTQLIKTLGLPSDFHSLFFGNGLKPWSELSIRLGEHQTDSGLVQIMFMYGIIPFFIYYFPAFYIWVSSFVSPKQKKKDLGYLFVAFPLAVLSEVKGHYIYSSLIFVLLFSAYFLRTDSVLDEK